MSDVSTLFIPCQVQAGVELRHVGRIRGEDEGAQSRELTRSPSILIVVLRAIPVWHSCWWNNTPADVHRRPGHFVSYSAAPGRRRLDTPTVAAPARTRPNPAMANSQLSAPVNAKVTGADPNDAAPVSAEA